MLNPPKTKAEAQAVRYGHRPRPYDPAQCAYMIYWPVDNYQCTRKPGHGPDELYCKQHAKMVK